MYLQKHFLKTVVELKTSSLATSLLVYLFQEDEVRYASVKGENVPIKTLHSTDNTASRVKVTLWRELTSTGDTRPGDYIKITDSIPNVYNSEISLSATSNSTVEVNIHHNNYFCLPSLCFSTFSVTSSHS
jgi:hypothetical protein